MSSASTTHLREVLGTWDVRKERDGHLLAPLSAAQADTITDLALAIEDRPLPDLPSGEDHTVQKSGESEAFGGSGSAESSLDPVVIDNTPAFLSWLARLEAHREMEQEATLHGHAKVIEEYSRRCEEILQEIDKAVAFLNDLKAEYTSVATKTNALHDDCEELLREQTALVNFAESIQSRLSYFMELERLTKKFNSPTLSVLSSEFVPLLSRLDECIEYMETHVTYHDAAAYLQKFRQLQARGLNLVKLHVINTLKMASQNVLTQTQGKEENPESFTLFYGKFRLHAPRIKSLMDELEKRQYATRTSALAAGAAGPAPVVNQEYALLLSDCYNCYFSQRSALLAVSIKKMLETLQGEHKDDLPGLVRAGCVYMMRVCSNEYELYRHFFSSMNVGLTVMLEDLTNMLYETCRPMYLSNPSLDTLVELVSVLKVEVLEDKGAETAAFATVASDMLQDVQIRLAYRAEQYIAAEIDKFVPSRPDMAYPERLTHGTDARDPKHDAATVYATWYPTLSKALLLLSKLYRSLDRKVFEGLSQEILYACIKSLCDASRVIGSTKGAVHGQLFLIKHLLILREQIAPFDVDFASTEVALDFKNLKDAATSLMAHTSGIFRMDRQNALLSFLVQGAPEITQRHLDARKEVDEQLRRVCQDYIRDATKTLSSTLQSFLTIADALPPASKQALGKQSFATPEKVRELVKENERKSNEELLSLSRLLHLYLDNKDTEMILFRPIKTDVMAVFQSFRSLVSQSYGAEDLAIIGCPSVPEMDLFLRLRAAPPTAAPAAAAAGLPASAPVSHSASAAGSQHATPAASTRASVSSPAAQEDAAAPPAVPAVHAVPASFPEARPDMDTVALEAPGADGDQ